LKSRTCEKIESVQRRFPKRFTCCGDLMYYERLATLGLDRLELRRLRFDLIYVYKILFGMVETDASNFFRVVTLVLSHADIVLNYLCHSRG